MQIATGQYPNCALAKMFDIKMRGGLANPKYYFKADGTVIAVPPPLNRHQNILVFCHSDLSVVIYTCVSCSSRS